MRTYLQISGTLFGIVAIAHIFRLYRQWPVEVAGYTLPLWVSWLGLLLAGGLSVWAFRLSRGSPPAA